MSDRPLADNWWLASDGKWYPPQSLTEQPPPTPPTAGANSVTPRRYVSFGLTGSLVGFFMATAALSGLGAVFYLGTWGLWRNFDNGGSTAFDEVNNLGAWVGIGVV